jgi:acyl-CoA synthetase (AMP-forming)/AMP-acid ligase II
MHMADSLSDFFSSLKFGETVIIEHPSAAMPEILFHLLTRFCSENGLPILIDDILDTYPQFVARMKVLGLPQPEARVIKIGGGKLEAGEVVGRIEVDKYSVPLGYYGSMRDKSVDKEKHINPVLGLYKLAQIFNRREVLSLLTTISSFVGDESRIAVYLINRDSADAAEPGFVPSFEEIATTVAEWYMDGEDFVLDVIKAANPELMGMEYRIPASEVLKG